MPSRLRDGTIAALVHRLMQMIKGEPPTLTEKQSALIRSSVPTLRERGEEITSLFYARLLEDNPELHNVFNEANLTTGRQPRALVAVMLSYAVSPTDTKELTPRLERVCHKHCSLGVRPEQYDLVGKYLLDAFAAVLGASWTRELYEAWAKSYGLLARMLTDREAQLYRGFGRWQTWRGFRVADKMSESHDQYSFYLVPEDGEPLPRFVPGQYVSVMVDVPALGYTQARQYCLSDAPRADYYRITVTRDRGIQIGRGIESFQLKPGLVSNLLLDKYEVGDVVSVSHPTGGFQLKEEGKRPAGKGPLVLISAGSGVTPLMSILNLAAERSTSRPLSWIHCSAHKPAFEDHVRQLASSRGGSYGDDESGHEVGGGGGGGGKEGGGRKGDGGDNENIHYPNNFTVRFLRSQLADIDYRRGSARAQGLKKMLEGLERGELRLDDRTAEYYICGPEAFSQDMLGFLRAQGVGTVRLHHEWFSTGELELKEYRTTLGKES